MAAAIVAIVGLTACADDSGRADAVDALSAELSARTDREDIDITDDDARCTAEVVVDDLGVARVEALDLTGTGEDGQDLDALSDEEIATVAGALGDCVDGIESVLVEAMQQGMLGEAGSDVPITDTEAECTARAIVDGFGTERLLITSISSEGDPFTDGTVTVDEAQIVADGFVDCVDLRAVFAQQFQAEGIPADTSSCLAAEIAEDDLRELFASQFSDRTVDADSLLGPAAATCGLR